MFPIVYKLMQKKKKIIFSVIFIFMLLNIYNSQFVYHKDPDNILNKFFNVSFIPWFYIFLLGAFFLLFKEYIYFTLKINFFIFLFLLIILKNISDDFGLNWYNSIHPLGYLMIVTIIIHVAFLKTIPPNILRKRDISYGIYICHLPIINFILYMYGNGYWQWIFSVLGTISIAVLSWHLIERPFLKIKKNALRIN